MNKIIAWIAKIALGGKLVAGVAWANGALSGHRSQILIGLIAIVHALKWAAIIQADVANVIETALAGALGPTLAEKISKAKASADAIVPDFKPETPKQ